MKLFKLWLFLVLVLLTSIAALASVSYIAGNDFSDDSIVIDSLFKEEECVEDSGDVICTETLYMQNDNGNKIPLMTGRTIKEIVFVPKYIETEKIIVREKKLTGEEKPSPADRITEDDVKTFSNRVVINVKNAKWRSYIDSNSMDPLIDEGTTTIEIKPKNADEIKVGDIVAYNVDGFDYAFVHRVIRIGEDGLGAYFITKGDNFYMEDPNKLRFSDIEGIVVGILY